MLFRSREDLSRIWADLRAVIAESVRAQGGTDRDIQKELRADRAAYGESLGLLEEADELLSANLATATRRKMIDDARECAVEAEKAQGLEAMKQYTEVLVEHKRKLEREMAGETNKLVPLFPLKLAIGRVNTALDKLKGAAADDNMLRVRQLLGNNADPQTIVMLEMISALKGMSVKNNQDSGVRSSVPDWPKFNDNIVNYFRFKTALLAL